MTKKKNILKALIILFVYLFVISAGSLQAQQVSKSKVMADKLQKKLLLSDEQKSAVESILNEYFDLVSKSEIASVKILRDKAEKKITALLDKKQRMKYDIVKDDWWALAE